MPDLRQACTSGKPSEDTACAPQEVRTDIRRCNFHDLR
jgi:hypothetical protein